MEWLPYLGLALFLLLLEGFFSGSETLLVACDKEKLKQRASEGLHGARLLERILERPERFLGVTQFGAGLALVLNTVLVTLLCLEGWGVRGLFWAVVFLVPVILLAGEIVPRAVFERKADQLAPHVVHLLWFASRVLAPVLWLMTALHMRVAGEPKAGLDNGAGSLRRDDLQQLIQVPQRGSDIQAEERRMVDRLMDLPGKTVEEVMVPLVDVVAVPETATREQAIRLFLEKGYSRLLVFRERIVHVVGTLHHFDLLLAPEDGRGIGPLVRPAYFVPETKPVYQLFLFMKKSGNKMAIAVDEYGGATGCITLEDILEEIVGEIEDEYDRSESLIRKIGPASYQVEARSEIGHLNERLSLDLPRGDYETLGGFLMSRMGRIPKAGDVLRLSNLVITVEKATPRSVRTLRLDLFEDPRGRRKPV
jgi:putative hemolysin